MVLSKQSLQRGTGIEIRNEVGVYFRALFILIFYSGLL